MPASFRPGAHREALIKALERAEQYVAKTPPESVGVLAVDKDERPVEIRHLADPSVVLRRATQEAEVMPAPAELGWAELAR